MPEWQPRSGRALHAMASGCWPSCGLASRVPLDSRVHPRSLEPSPTRRGAQSRWLVAARDYGLPALFIVPSAGWFLAHVLDFGLDDSYITYRYASNLELGHGFVFNVGERYLGTTAPGFGLLLAFLHWLVSVLDLSRVLAAL